MSDDYDSYFEDTLRAGHYENRKESVDIMLRSSRHVIDQLLHYGVDFQKNPDGSLCYIRMGTKHVWLSFENIPEEEIRSHFPNILATCLEAGYDITKEPAPVVPAQHYFMGGVHVDSNSATTMPHLYAVGETSCNGVHGKNRLASNSLLESLVFAERAAAHICGSRKGC